MVRSPAPAGLLRLWCVAGGLRPTPWVCPLPAVPGECLAALLVSPAGWLALRYPLVLEGLYVVRSPALAILLRLLVCSRWPPVYPGVCRHSRRCPMSTWDTRPYERIAAGRSTGHITDYGGAARLTGY